METTASAPMADMPNNPVNTDVAPNGVASGTTEVSKDQKPDKRTFKGKVNGREVEVDEDTLVKNWQKYEAADERFRQAAEKEKRFGKYEEFEKALQNKDLSILSKYVDPDTIRQFSEKQLLEWLEYQGLSDEQKELLETKNRLKEYETKEEQRQREEEEQARLQVNSQAIKLLDQEIADTFTELKEKPTPAKIMRMAMHMHAALSQEKPVFMSGKEAYRRASADLKSDLTGYLESLDEKEIPNVLPKRVLDAIRKHSIETAQAPFARRNTQESQPSQTTERVRASTDDYFKKLDEKYNRR